MCSATGKKNQENGLFSFCRKRIFNPQHPQLPFESADVLFRCPQQEDYPAHT
jgi:hypothetical protein